MTVTSGLGAPSPARTREAFPRVDILGVGVSAITMADALGAIRAWIEHGEQHYVCVTGVHGVMECQRDEALLRIHRRAGMVTPDGMPLVWLCWRSGYRRVERVYGPDLMLAACARSRDAGYRHFFYGGAPGVPEKLQARLQTRLPGLDVVGTYSPPFRPLTRDEDDRVVQQINASQADIVWVGLSTPKQERWMASHVGRVRAPVLVGVGAAFDFHAGVKRQAPRWMGRCGLEWLFRMSAEPKRLIRRYARNNPLFVYQILQTSWESRRRPTDNDLA